MLKTLFQIAAKYMAKRRQRQLNLHIRQAPKRIEESLYRLHSKRGPLEAWRIPDDDVYVDPIVKGLFDDIGLISNPKGRIDYLARLGGIIQHADISDLIVRDALRLDSPQQAVEALESAECRFVDSQSRGQRSSNRNLLVQAWLTVTNRLELSEPRLSLKVQALRHVRFGDHLGLTASIVEDMQGYADCRDSFRNFVMTRLADEKSFQKIISSRFGSPKP